MSLKAAIEVVEKERKRPPGPCSDDDI